MGTNRIKQKTSLLNEWIDMAVWKLETFEFSKKLTNWIHRLWCTKDDPDLIFTCEYKWIRNLRVTWPFSRDTLPHILKNFFNLYSFPILTCQFSFNSGSVFQISPIKVSVCTFIWVLIPWTKHALPGSQSSHPRIKVHRSIRPMNKTPNTTAFRILIRQDIRPRRTFMNSVM